uniref:Serine protease K12H4.7 n=1 Tax=Rhabditophanes sp. KR3021 TaxID=114890 RepID=A0AC35U7D9_9BILA
MGSNQILICSVLILSLVSLIQSHRPIPSALRFFNGRPYDGFRQTHKLIADEDLNEIHSTKPEDAYTFYYNQALDHNDSTDLTKWSQRYFYNGEMYQDGGPQFLVLGGEGPQKYYDVVLPVIPHVKWASELNGMVFALEHRFYGKSRPFPNQSTENLAYLTSQQALADAAAFITDMNIKYNIQKPNWIIIGGSYSGALALWFRQKYPQLCVGAVGSSAPVEPTADFYQYLEVCEASIYSFGSKKCGDNIKKGMKSVISSLYDKDGRAALSKTFKLVPSLDATDLDYKLTQNFVSSIVGSFMGAVQYNRVNSKLYRDSSSIPDVCKIMENGISDNILRLAKVTEYIQDMASGVKYPNPKYQGLDYSYNEVVQFLKNATFDNDDIGLSASRSWIYQTCNEFGYYQSTDTQTSIWGASIPFNFYIDLCTDVFGSKYNSDYVKKAVDQTRINYGGANGYNATNVVMPNGDLDPWHALGCYNSSDFTMVPYLIHNTAHCADMEPELETDQPQLKYVRKLIFRNIKNWLGIDSDFAIGHQVQPINNIASNVKAPIPHPHTPSPVKGIKLGLHPNFLSEIEPKNHSFKRNGMVHGMKEPIESIKGRVSLTNVIIGSITQMLDHFNNTDVRTFEQKYYWNSQYSKKNGVYFLMIGGEGPIGLKWVSLETIPMLQMAKDAGAEVYELEHRFYGDHSPTGDLTVDSLQFLTSKQALADLAVFIKSINHINGETNAKWVLFGGSYSGALAAWARELYPELSVGAVASSGPLLAKTDFYEYLQVVQKSYETYSSSCASNIRRVFKHLQKMLLSQSGRDALNGIFHLTKPWAQGEVVDEMDAQSFMSEIYSYFQGAVQYSHDNTGNFANGFGIPEVCAIMNSDEASLITNLKNVILYIDGGPSQVSNRYQDTIDYYLGANYMDGSSAAVNWLWQSCNEFGFFQSSDGGYNLFDSACSVNVFINTCKDVFGPQFTRRYIEANVARTNMFYGGNTNYNGSNVIMVYGSVDPWHSLGSYKQDTANNVQSYLITGTAHCSDLYPARASDVPDLTSKRLLVKNAVNNFLGLGGDAY